MPSEEGEPARLASDGVSVELTHNPLDILKITKDVKSPKAGAIVLFAGPNPYHETPESARHVADQAQP